MIHFTKKQMSDWYEKVIRSFESGGGEGRGRNEAVAEVGIVHLKGYESRNYAPFDKGEQSGRSVTEKVIPETSDRLCIGSAQNQSRVSECALSYAGYESGEKHNQASLPPTYFWSQRQKKKKKEDDDSSGMRLLSPRQRQRA
jgi:hypothetical protein